MTSVADPVDGRVSLLDEARRIGPDLEAAIEEGEELRRLPDSVWTLLLDCGVLRALQPSRWGGGEVQLVHFIDAVIEISRVSPAAGWVAGVIGVHPWQLALFDDRAQRDMWGDDPRTMHSTSYNPTGSAEKVDGGYRVTGRWSFSSGCDHCRGVNLGAIVPGVGGPIPDFRSFLLLPGEYRIDDNWHVSGLRGTGSKDIVVDGAFVPEYRTQSHIPYALGEQLPGQELNDGVLYRLPWSVVFNSAIAASALGSAKGFIEMWTAETRSRKVPGVGPLADDPLTQRRLAEALWDLDAAVALMRSDARTVWEMGEAGVRASMADKARFRWNMTRGVERLSDAVAELWRTASGRAVFLDHPLQRRFQDFQAALGHAYLGTDVVARAVGGALLGAAKTPLIL